MTTSQNPVMPSDAPTDISTRVLPLAQALARAAPFAAKRVVFGHGGALVVDENYGRYGEEMAQQWITATTAGTDSARQAAVALISGTPANFVMVPMHTTQDPAGAIFYASDTISPYNTIPRATSVVFGRPAYMATTGYFFSPKEIQTVVRDLLLHGHLLPEGEVFYLGVCEYTQPYEDTRSAHARAHSKRVYALFSDACSATYPLSIKSDLMVCRHATFCEVYTYEGGVAMVDLSRSPTDPAVRPNTIYVAHAPLYTPPDFTIDGLLRFLEDLGVVRCEVGLHGSGDEGNAYFDPTSTVVEGVSGLDHLQLLPQMDLLHSVTLEDQLVILAEAEPDSGWENNAGSSGVVRLQPKAPPEKRIQVELEYHPETYDDDDQEEGEGDEDEDEDAS